MADSLIDGLAALRRLLREAPPLQSGLTQLHITLPVRHDHTILPWLASQQIWPQFYWQQRDARDEIMALGACQTFGSMAQATRFQRHYPQAVICGLNAFDAASGQLFLPRLLWHRTRQGISLTLNILASQQNAPGADTIAFLESLHHGQPLRKFNAHIRAETQLPERPDWTSLIQRATEAIGRGEMAKVVLARASDILCEDAPLPTALLEASRRVNAGCYHFLMAFDAHSAFLGSSPECLWRREGRALYTEALAGTVAAGVNDEEARRFGDWLLQDEKNRRENHLVVEDICQRLQGEADAIRVAAPEILRLRNVQHLRCAIEAILHQPDDLICQRRLQPTAAVAGLPRDTARAFIKRYEPFEREWYAGSCGWFSAERAEFCVSLRSASVCDNRVRLYAGAGIVAGSQPDQEWQEIDNKVDGLRSLFFGDAV